MRSGKLRHQVVIQTKAQTQDPQTGEIVVGWVEFATVWASVDPLSAREFMAAQAGQSEITARITIRYRPGVLPTMRVLHRGAAYAIQGVLSDPKSGRDYLTLPVSEGVSDG